MGRRALGGSGGRVKRVWVFRFIGLILLIALMFVLADLQRKLVRLNDLRATSKQSR